MVKNTKGGSGHKSQARKFATNSSGSSKTRYSEDEYEYYAQVTATLGNGMCHVICIDGKKRLCIIRGKFRGRGKKDNIINNGKWVLVGGRDFEMKKEGTTDLEKCDLLEVYSDLDKERLKATGKFYDFVARDNLYCNQEKTTSSDFVDFSENLTEDEYKTMMEKDIHSQAPSQNETISLTIDENDSEVNIDDI